MRINRIDALYSLWEFAFTSNIPIHNIFGVTDEDCSNINHINNLCMNWVEYPGQQIGATSRVDLTRTFRNVEQDLRNFLGYSPGPEIFHGEIHKMGNIHGYVRLDYNKVIATGSPIYTQITHSGITKVFHDSNNWGFGNCIRYTLAAPMINGEVFDNPESLFLFQPSYDLVLGNRMRPFEAVILPNGDLQITLPTIVAINHDLYSEYPNLSNIIRAVDLCELTNYPDEIEVYQRTFSLPSGTLYYQKFNRCCDSGDCDACQLPELMICLEPINPEYGEFRVKPIVNTADEGEEPCYEVSNDWGKCCDQLGVNHSTHCLLKCPVYIKVDYIAGCGNCYGDSDIIDGICDEFLEAMKLLTYAKMPNVCECSCMASLIEHWQDDLLTVGRNRRFTNAGDPNQYFFGVVRGAVDAYYTLKHIRRIRQDTATRL